MQGSQTKKKNWSVDHIPAFADDLLLSLIFNLFNLNIKLNFKNYSLERLFKKYFRGGSHRGRAAGIGFNFTITGPSLCYIEHLDLHSHGWFTYGTYFMY